MREVVAVTRRHAARYDQMSFAELDPVEVGDFENCIDAFLSRRLNERARVHYDGVGRFRLIHYRIACVCEPRGHMLGVHFVLRAPHGHEGDRLPVQRAVPHLKPA